MERIKERLQLTKNALSALLDSITLLQDAKNDLQHHKKKQILAYQDSVIKRFEFSYELFWKFLKEYLEVQHGILVSSPKKVFLECRTNGILQEPEVVVLLSIVDSRNSTTHEYNEIMAAGVANAVCNSYYTLLTAIINRLESSV